MKKIKFYICPICGNLFTAMEEGSISCCGKKLKAMDLHKSSDDEKLSVEKIENDYFISAKHEQSKAHYISFVAIVTGDSIMLRRLYPEWDVQTRLPAFAHGMLVWCCTVHGLQYQLI